MHCKALSIILSVLMCVCGGGGGGAEERGRKEEVGWVAEATAVLLMI